MAKEKCDRNCATCGVDNRSFCAIQIAMANQELLMGLVNGVTQMNNSLAPLFSDGPAPLSPSVTGEDKS